MPKKNGANKVANGPALAAHRSKPKNKHNRTPKLTTARLKKLAKKHKPPQGWFDNEEEGLY